MKQSESGNRWEQRLEQLRLLKAQDGAALTEQEQEELDRLEHRVRVATEIDAEMAGGAASTPEKDRRPRKRLRATVEKPAVVAALEEYAVALSSTEPGQLNHEYCVECGCDSLSVVINEDGGGAWNCKKCGWTNEPEEVIPNFRGRRRTQRQHWYHALPPEGQAWFARLLRDQCSELPYDLLLTFRLTDDYFFVPLTGDDLVEAVWPLLDADRRFRSAWSAAARGLKAELRTASEAVKELGGKHGWPPKWITQDAAIRRNLARRGNSRLLDLCGLIRGAKWPFRRCQEWPLDGPEYPLLVELPYGRAQRELALSYEQVNQHLRAMAAWGLVRDSGRKAAKHGRKLWILGHWNEGGGLHPNPIFFLKECTKMRRALRRIDVCARDFGYKDRAL
jgi:hypothetical protein